MTVADPLDGHPCKPAAAAARKVFMNACAAWPLAPSAEPALKPNHPNHRMPVPIITSGIECGGALRSPLRLPSTSTAASEAMPALTWIAVPPAKSSEPRWPSQPPNTHLKTGTYTRNNHSGTNDRPGRELHAVGDRAGDQSRCDRGEHTEEGDGGERTAVSGDFDVVQEQRSGSHR